MHADVFRALVELLGGDEELAKEFAALVDSTNRENAGGRLIHREESILSPSEILDAAGVPRWGCYE